MAYSPVNAKKPNRKNSEGSLKNNNDELVAHTGNTLTEAATIRRAEITAERGNYQTLERGHKDATRARDAAISTYNAEIECRRSAEKLADE